MQLGQCSHTWAWAARQGGAGRTESWPGALARGKAGRGARVLCELDGLHGGQRNREKKSWVGAGAGEVVGTLVCGQLWLVD